ncbi:MAG: tRNA (N(6)-L-threonylcarbamoyladenosine(37)-C(2))-methylthiotransferase MtaB [Candidatus Izemoplasmatales bacterium]|nr:tRNA (N(6)-L-threonylcarbamoyladenosine(37)-C(2))-methylthiotransferase MtaB [Candidatus Izemoplasmatales bacterium]
MKISYCSLGCKVNLYESEAIINEFIDKGYELVDFDQMSDVYIINTCTVTTTSDAKSRKMIRQATRKNKDAIIAVMGCFSQLNPEQVKKIPGVNIVLGTTNRHKMVELVEEALIKRENKCLIAEYSDIKDYEELKIKKYNHKTRGFVKIQDGCNNFCSYCAIPYARGPIRSRKKEDVIAEIETLTAQGMKEIVLSGINTGTYGKDFLNYNFSNLLADIVKEVENLGRIRISSIEATEISDELLTTISENKEHFCQHFHIPLQGGCNNTLKRMNRKYDIAYYYQKIVKIREYFPDVNITTDCLAGFNGETERDFLDSVEFIKSLNFGEMHIFPFSPRPNTMAYKLPGRIDGITQKFRVNELLTINKIKALEYREKFIGKIVEVIVEKNEAGLAFGHSSNYLEVEFFSEKAKSNDLVHILIEKAGYPVSRGVAIDV